MNTKFRLLVFVVCLMPGSHQLFAQAKFHYSEASPQATTVGRDLDREFTAGLNLVMKGQLSSYGKNIKTYLAGADFVIWPRLQFLGPTVAIRINVYKIATVNNLENDNLTPYFSAGFDRNDRNSYLQWIRSVIDEIVEFREQYDPNDKATQSFKGKKIYLDIPLTIDNQIKAALRIQTESELEGQLAVSLKNHPDMKDVYVAYLGDLLERNWKILFNTLQSSEGKRAILIVDFGEIQKRETLVTMSPCAVDSLVETLRDTTYSNQVVSALINKQFIKRRR